jgi:hypothetical protein
MSFSNYKTYFYPDPFWPSGLAQSGMSASGFDPSGHLIGAISGITRSSVVSSGISIREKLYLGEIENDYLYEMRENWIPPQIRNAPSGQLVSGTSKYLWQLDPFSTQTSSGIFPRMTVVEKFNADKTKNLRFLCKRSGHPNASGNDLKGIPSKGFLSDIQWASGIRNAVQTIYGNRWSWIAPSSNIYQYPRLAPSGLNRPVVTQSGGFFSGTHLNWVYSPQFVGSGNAYYDIVSSGRDISKTTITRKSPGSIHHEYIQFLREYPSVSGFKPGPLASGMKPGHYTPGRPSGIGTNYGLQDYYVEGDDIDFNLFHDSYSNSATSGLHSFFYTPGDGTVLPSSFYPGRTIDSTYFNFFGSKNRRPKFSREMLLNSQISVSVGGPVYGDYNAAEAAIPEPSGLEATGALSESLSITSLSYDFPVHTMNGVLSHSVLMPLYYLYDSPNGIDKNVGLPYNEYNSPSGVVLTDELSIEVQNLSIAESLTFPSGSWVKIKGWEVGITIGTFLGLPDKTFGGDPVAVRQGPNNIFDGTCQWIPERESIPEYSKYYFETEEYKNGALVSNSVITNVAGGSLTPSKMTFYPTIDDPTLLGKYIWGAWARSSMAFSSNYALKVFPQTSGVFGVAGTQIPGLYTSFPPAPAPLVYANPSNAAGHTIYFVEPWVIGDVGGQGNITARTTPPAVRFTKPR